MSNRSPTSLSRDFARLDVVALTTIEGFGPATIRAHLERIRTEARAMDDGLPPGVFSAAQKAAKKHLATADRIGARCVMDGDADYPESLLALQHPPLVLWVMGDLSAVMGPPVIAIVGTRECTDYGERVTRSIASAFARAGATVLSGMARGIDARAHAAAMETGGRTAAVLGTGVDVPYPAAHRGLHARIRAHGVVISEGPPGLPAAQGCFPRRNRIIAALAGATIVVEAGVKSGALNTALWSDGIGRKVGGIPGPIDSPASLGVNLLLRDGGAHPIATTSDALALLSLSEPGRSAVELHSPAEQAVWGALERAAASFDVLCGRTGLPARLCLETVTALEIRGLVECAMTGELRRR
ncbi:MAG TPA: DNA-processing protein DprA [Gemmatimonadaceae bacterium]|nr:DNA-processing protein DprA [Gemmatimonadaceae bacterium]